MKRREHGIALVMALITLVVMLICGLYIMRSANTATVATGNLAYQRAIGRATDFGIETAYTWLTTIAPPPPAAGNKALLDADSPANGYVAHYPFSAATVQATYLDAIFWNGSTTANFVDASGTTLTVEYVIHRYCTITGSYNQAGNSCVSTVPGNTSLVGRSIEINPNEPLPPPLIHYLITARITGGAKGASAVNESLVMIGA